MLPNIIAVGDSIGHYNKIYDSCDTCKIMAEMHKRYTVKVTHFISIIIFLLNILYIKIMSRYERCEDLRDD